MASISRSSRKPCLHARRRRLPPGRQPGNADFRRNLEESARNIGLRVAIHEIEGVDRFAAAFAWAKSQAVDGVYVIQDPVFSAHDRTIFKLAIDYRMPTTAGRLDWVHAGAMLSYAIDIIAIARRTGRYIREILRGTDPATLPIEQPTEVNLAVNLATARALESGCQFAAGARYHRG